MTYQNDPNLNRNINARRADPNSRNDTTMWIAGAAALLLVFGMIAFSLTNRSEVATNAPRTPVTESRTTTGSGATTIPNNPNGTTPQKELSKPAQVPTAPTAR
jgi:hypothetical protein